jgi:phosphoglucosamine mutase
MSDATAKRRYFGTDGIRGYANKSPMTAETAMKVGMAAGVKLRQGGHRHRVVIGKDTRLSGYMLENALVAGFTAAGMDALLLGPVPTPAVAMLTRSMRADIGVMISASHNPYHDNGIKLFGHDGFKLSNADETALEDLIDQDLSHHMASGESIGKATRIEGVGDRYVETAKRTLPRNMSLTGMRVVLDCANGAAYKVAPQALWELGADVIVIGDEPNGLNINSECGSTDTAALQNKVNEVRADIGIALDGDADRVIIVDEKSKVVDGDQLMAVVAESWKEKDRLASNGIVATIMSNLGLERYLNSIDLSLARTAVGDRHVVEHMRKHGFNVGGEQSGHIVLSDYATTGDGLVAALQVMTVVKESDREVSAICNRFTPVPQVLKNVRYSQGEPLEAQEVEKAIADAREKLANTGRIVIRKSGTEPLIRVMAEGDDETLINNVVDEICGTLRKAAA